MFDCLQRERWNRKMTQRRPATRRRCRCCKFCFRIFLLWTLAILFWTPILHKVYYMPMNYEGETLTPQEMFANVLESDGWREFGSLCEQLWAQIENRGWNDLLNEILKEMDVGGDDRAASVLGVDLNDESLTESQLRKVRNKLALKYHPDRCLGMTPDEQKVAEEKYRQIQEAYEKCVKILKNRETNSRSRPSSQENSRKSKRKSRRSHDGL